MGLLKKVGKFIAEYFVFLGGFLFLFVIGFLYAMIRPEGLVFNIIFLFIVTGWIIFLIKYFWDILEKQKVSEKDSEQNSEQS